MCFLCFAGSACNQVIGGDDLSVREVESGHHRRMDMRGRDCCATEIQIARGAGVVNSHGAVAKVVGRTDRRVDSHVAHCADHDHFLDPLFVEQVLEAGPAKGVGIVLGDDRLTLSRCDDLVDLGPLRSGNENRPAGHLMSNIHDRIAGLAPVGDNAGGANISADLVWFSGGFPAGSRAKAHDGSATNETMALPSRGQ